MGSIISCLFMSQAQRSFSFVLYPNGRCFISSHLQTKDQISFSSLDAIIYDWNDEPSSNNKQTTFPSFDDIHSHYSYNDNDTITMKDHLKNDIAQLARLATVFAPQDQSLTLEKIHHIDILSVDGKSIEMSVVVCEEAECVTLFVPISFRHGNCDCPSESLDECILKNINQLDTEAQEILRTKHEVTNTQDISSLSSDTNMIYPSWWVFPSGIDRDMCDECMTIRQLLNSNDFQGALNSLVRKGLESMNEVGEIQGAAVVAVGPAGMLLRAQVARGNDSTVIDIPYSFGQVARDSISLRSITLQAIQ